MYVDVADFLLVQCGMAGAVSAHPYPLAPFTIFVPTCFWWRCLHSQQQTPVSLLEDHPQLLAPALPVQRENWMTDSPGVATPASVLLMGTTEV